MIKISDIDSINRISKDYSTLKSLSFTRNQNNSGFDGSMIFLKNIGHEELGLIFMDARNISINEQVDSLSGIFLYIEDIQSYQWEGVIFKIKDLSDEAFSFYCKGVQAYTR